jgi:23S rRNA (cytosine1962-C5)-methyltransferase
VVIDPPTNQRGSFVAEKHYGNVLKRLPELCADGAEVLACLNSPFLNADFLPQQMMRRAPGCELVERMPASPDFPERYPDRGLKVYRFRFRG